MERIRLLRFSKEVFHYINRLEYYLMITALNRDLKPSLKFNGSGAKIMSRIYNYKNYIKNLLELQTCR